MQLAPTITMKTVDGAIDQTRIYTTTVPFTISYATSDYIDADELKYNIATNAARTMFGAVHIDSIEDILRILSRDIQNADPERHAFIISAAKNAIVDTLVSAVDARATELYDAIVAATIVQEPVLRFG